MGLPERRETIQYLYSVRDNKSGFYPPMIDVNDQTAIRNFAYAMNNTAIYAFSPKDYDLYLIGTFNATTGVIDRVDIPELLVSGTSVFNVKE